MTQEKNEQEFEGKTIDDAIARGLEVLKTTKDNVKITVLSEATHGLFGLLGSKPARIRISMPRTEEDKLVNLLKNILNDILDLSKIDASELVLQEDMLEISSLKSFALAGLKSLVEAEHKSIEFSVDVDEDVPKIILGDEMRIKQVLWNMIGNAVKYTRKGFIQVRLYCSGEDLLVFAVEDINDAESATLRFIVFSSATSSKTPIRITLTELASIVDVPVLDSLRSCNTTEFKLDLNETVPLIRRVDSSL